MKATHFVRCDECERGRIEIMKGDQVERVVDCDACDGSGKIEKDNFDCECDQCQDCFFVCSDSYVVSRHLGVIDAIIEATRLAALANGERSYEVIKGVYGNNLIFRTWGQEWTLKQKISQFCEV